MEQLGKMVKVVNTSDPYPTVGDMVNSSQRRRTKSKRRAKDKLDTVGMDIPYGKKVGPGGKRYTLMLVNQATRYCWVYRMKDTSGQEVVDAL